MTSVALCQHVEIFQLVTRELMQNVLHVVVGNEICIFHLTELAYRPDLMIFYLNVQKYKFRSPKQKYNKRFVSSRYFKNNILYFCQTPKSSGWNIRRVQCRQVVAQILRPRLYSPPSNLHSARGIVKWYPGMYLALMISFFGNFEF